MVEVSNFLSFQNGLCIIQGVPGSACKSRKARNFGPGKSKRDSKAGQEQRGVTEPFMDLSVLMGEQGCDNARR